MPFPIPEPEVIAATAARLVDTALDGLITEIEDPGLLDAVLARLLAASTDAATFSYTQYKIAKIVAVRLHYNWQRKRNLQ